ncbi:MAG: hypothetical protein M3N07_05470 [Pseudomonadota bacterium]|nr:hypothetical protein [Pseudomonadota bacterium]
MAHLSTRLGAAAIFGGALLLSACSGGDETNNAAANALDNVAFGNTADPAALETMTNTGESGLNGTGDTAAPPATTTAPPPPPPPVDRDPTDVGGDIGGNMAGGTVNGM